MNDTAQEIAEILDAVRAAAGKYRLGEAMKNE
jgi:hypothetical protein